MSNDYEIDGDGNRVLIGLSIAETGEFLKLEEVGGRGGGDEVTALRLCQQQVLLRQPLQRLVLAQDTGTAIKGGVRGDFFWGFGAEAGAQAGRMRQKGEMWVLWPRDQVPR